MESSDEEFIDGEEVYKVESIVAHQFNAQLNRDEWFVKWENYPHIQNTWEPFEHFQGNEHDLNSIFKDYLYLNGIPKGSKSKMKPEWRKSPKEPLPSNKKRKRENELFSSGLKKQSDLFTSNPDLFTDNPDRPSLAASESSSSRISDSTASITTTQFYAKGEKKRSFSAGEHSRLVWLKDKMKRMKINKPVNNRKKFKQAMDKVNQARLPIVSTKQVNVVKANGEHTAQCKLKYETSTNSAPGFKTKKRQKKEKNREKVKVKKVVIFSDDESDSNGQNNELQTEDKAGPSKVEKCRVSSENLPLVVSPNPHNNIEHAAVNGGNMEDLPSPIDMGNNNNNNNNNEGEEAHDSSMRPNESRQKCYLMLQRDYQHCTDIIQQTNLIIKLSAEDCKERRAAFDQSNEIEIGYPMPNIDATQAMHDIIHKLRPSTGYRDVLCEFGTKSGDENLPLPTRIMCAFQAGKYSKAVKLWEQWKMQHTWQWLANEIDSHKDELMMIILMEQNKDTNNGVTPLMKLTWDWFAAVEQMNEKDIPDKFGCCDEPLDKSVERHAYCRAIQFITKRCPFDRLNSCTMKSKWNALHMALQLGAPCVIKTLINAGILVSEKDAYGVSPLHKAVERGDIEIMKWIVDAGANIQCYDLLSRKTPLEMCDKSSALYKWLKQWHNHVQEVTLPMIKDSFSVLSNGERCVEDALHSVNMVPLRHFDLHMDWVYKFKVPPPYTTDNRVLWRKCVIFVMLNTIQHAKFDIYEEKVIDFCHIKGLEVIFNGEKQELLASAQNKHFYLFSCENLAMALNVVKISLPKADIEKFGSDVLISAQAWTAV